VISQGDKRNPIATLTLDRSLFEISLLQMGRLTTKLSAYRAVLLTALLVQIVAVSIGTVILHSCTQDSPYLTHRFWNSLYWSLVGPVGLMFFIAHITLPGLAVIALLVISGLSWRRGWFLWVIGILLWGILWVFLVLILCGIQND
jgi:hypothetical protein